MSSSTFPKARLSFSASGAVEVSHHRLGRAYRLVAMVEGNEAMLLPAHAKGHDFVAALADFFQAALDDALGCITPGLRILFDMTPRQPLDKRVPRAGLSEGFSGINLEDQTLAGSCPTVETEA